MFEGTDAGTRMTFQQKRDVTEAGPQTTFQQKKVTVLMLGPE